MGNAKFPGPEVTAFPDDWAPRSRSDLSSVELDGEAVILDGSSGELHHLNQSATLVLSLCDGSRTVGTIAGELSELFGMPTDVMIIELRRALTSLGEADLLDAVPTGSSPTSRDVPR
jgi:hypothetical protein